MIYAQLYRVTGKVIGTDGFSSKKWEIYPLFEKDNCYNVNSISAVSIWICCLMPINTLSVLFYGHINIIQGSGYEIIYQFFS